MDSQKTLNIVRRYRPQFLAEPVQPFQLKTLIQNQQETKIIQEEIDTLLEKEAIEPIPHNQAKFVSNFFLVKTKSGGFKPVINLRNLNQFIHTEHFTMETITNLRTMLSKDDWIMTADISDVHLTFTPGRGVQGLCSFPVSGSDLQISVHAFQPKRCYKAFTKAMKHHVAKVRALGFKVLVYLDDRLLAPGTMPLCLKQSQFLVNFFRINFEKSSLTPSQTKNG